MSRCVVVGAGAREHALAWALSRDAAVVVTPGNVGMAAHGIDCADTPATGLEGDLFVIGPEEPLVDGLADTLRAQGKSVFGPGADGARLEGSKAYLKEFLSAAGVPSAAYGAFAAADEDAAQAFLSTMAPPYVIKTDGLAAGKGVLVTRDLAEARRDVQAKLSGVAFGDAGRTVVIEEGLEGEECSLHALFDGVCLQAMAGAQDFKRVRDDDVGANTGGMGAFAPTAFHDAVMDRAWSEILTPTGTELRTRGINYRGVLYAGIMLTTAGPKLLEYNVRFGDPETEALVPLYGTTDYQESLYQILKSVADGRLGDRDLLVSRGAAVTVVLASEGYPHDPRVGDPIQGLGEDGQLATPLKDVIIFHAGTARDRHGRFVTNGGRVLAITGMGDSVRKARARAYEAASLVTFRGCVRRSDIARRAAEGEQ